MGLAGIELGLAVSGLAQLASPGPIIFQLGPLAIRWYGLLIAIALALGIALAPAAGPAARA
jgi:phosphatidylglycerol:prolipoprotein diacylglycerol transferase